MALLEQLSVQSCPSHLKEMQASLRPITYLQRGVVAAAVEAIRHKGLGGRTHCAAPDVIYRKVGHVSVIVMV